jgi:hypothetical protein
MGTENYFLVVKRQDNEDDQTPPCSAEVKNAWSYTPIPPYVSIAQCLIKHKGIFTSTIILHVNTNLLQDQQRGKLDSIHQTQVEVSWVVTSCSDVVG